MLFDAGRVGRQTATKTRALTNAGIYTTPILALDFMTPGTLDPRITFTRASTATYTDASGTIRTAATNAPRWDYAGGVLRGLLIEEARTNSLSPSVPGATWVSNGAVQALGGSVIAPDGTTATTSRIMSSDTTNSVRSFAVSAGITANTTFTVTAFMKRDGHNAYMQINTGGGSGAAAVAYYDLAAGTAVVGADLSPGLTNKSVSIIVVSNGWYRVSFTLTDTGGNTAANPYIGPCTTVSGVGDNRSYVGVVGQGLYLWGAQVEQGAFPTSYIPTTAAAATRAQDSCAISPANMTPWFASPGGSWFAEFISIVPSPSSARVIGEPTSSGGGTGSIFLTSSPNFSVGQFDQASVVGTTNTTTANVIAKAVSTWAIGQAKICLNAGPIASSAALTAGYGNFASLGVKFLTVATATGVSDNVSGTIRRVSYWPRVLSDAEMQQVTT